MPMPPPYGPRHGRNRPWLHCQHCERLIEVNFRGDWQDSEGFTVCQKYTGPLSYGEQPPFLTHTPMPVIT
jgi:hypothetical protein